MKQALRFSIVGEDDDVHEVSIERDVNNSTNLSAHCTCGKALEGEFCLHRFEVLEGDTNNMVSENLDDVRTLREWIKGSDIEIAMQALSKAKTDLRLAHEKVESRRQALVRRMLD